MIHIDGLSKRFGDIKAVNDLSFTVKKGELFAFLGVNGAGKSTTISIICGQLQSDGGSVKIAGLDPVKDSEAVRRLLGVVFQDSALDKALTVRDNLAVNAHIVVEGEYPRGRKKSRFIACLGQDGSSH